MKVTVSGMPPNAGFDLFVIQQAAAPFGVAWYQTDVQASAYGTGSATVRGVFDFETFSVSVGGSTTFSPTHQYRTVALMSVVAWNCLRNVSTLSPSAGSGCSISLPALVAWRSAVAADRLRAGCVSTSAGRHRTPRQPVRRRSWALRGRRKTLRGLQTGPSAPPAKIKSTRPRAPSRP